ncbi:MAG: hydrogenase maturation protease [Thermoanaerobaculia bacterium]
MNASSTLVLAWGNPGRRDDGLGPSFASAVGALGLPRVAVESQYQLQVEDAMQLAAFRRVWFVDADRCGDEPFLVRRVEPEAGGIGFTSHSISPGRLLALARDLFGAEPEAWLMGIRGYDFDRFGEGLSPRARANLALAVDFARDALGEDEVGGEGTAARAALLGPAQATRG